MNSIKKIILSVLFLSTIFISCSDDDEPKQPVIEYDNVAYIVNYGGYNAGNGEISIYNTDDKTITQDGYKAANGVSLASNIQSMSIHDDVAYLMSNAGDKIDILDATTLKALGNPISTDITKPRYFTASKRFGYISCWGKVDDWNVMANSYIAKMDLESNTITKLDLPGGPEGVIVSDNKLYVASSINNEVTVINLTNFEITKTITVSAVPQQFVIDDSGNIWVSMVSKYSTPFPGNKLGFAIINPKNDTVIEEVNFPGIGSEGWIAISPDKKTIYAMGADAWPGTATTIYTIDVANKTLGASALISGEKYYGFNVSPENGDIYVLIAPDTSAPGTLEIYGSNGTLLSTEVTGPGPNHVVYYAIEKK